jgi:hypothetical protein
VLRKDKLLLACYIDIRGLDDTDAAQYIAETAAYMNKNEDGDDSVEMIVIPIRGESRVECINPVIVGSEKHAELLEAADKAMEKMKEFTKNLEK